MPKDNVIQVFEHQFLPFGEKFKKHHFVALSKLNALHNDLYFDLRHNGIKFRQYVGVIQINGLTIEILPKIDNTHENKVLWQQVLVNMLKVTKRLKVEKAGEANVSRQNIHLFDIYFELFLNEIQNLIHQGLIKQYYKETSNVKALKGKLKFDLHLSKNIVHKERFYTTHQVYDKDHLVHQILSKALKIISTLTKGSYLYGKCKIAELNFPDVKEILVNENTFTKIPKTRKTVPYENALAIARLIILNYAPNIASGNEKMLALLFDMNQLWEEYILTRLKQANKDVEVYGQKSRFFWGRITMRPDIVIKKEDMHFVIDTKWKNIQYGQPSSSDLRQMYVYNDYWASEKAMLLYPSNISDESPEFICFESITENATHHKCATGRISIFNPDNKTLNKDIGLTILEWFNEKKEIKKSSQKKSPV